MQRAKLFGPLFAYVNNIQITWKTIHLSVFCRTNRWKEKIQWQSVTNGLRKEHVLRSPFLFLDKILHFF